MELFWCLKAGPCVTFIRSRFFFLIVGFINGPILYCKTVGLDSRTDWYMLRPNPVAFDWESADDLSSCTEPTDAF